VGERPGGGGGGGFSHAPPRGSRVLELGCGLALPSVVAALSGADVLATDGAPDAVAFAAHVLALNELEGAEVALVDWSTHGDALVDRGPWEVVLASDVLYTGANVQAALALVPRLLAPGGELRLADPGRSGARDFLAAMRGAFTIRTERREDVALHRLRPRVRS
jgi:predicted nicotinamide N-methyase